MRKDISDPLSIPYRLKTFFNFYIRNHKGDSLDKVQTLVDMFDDYFHNMMKGEIDKRKTPKGKEKYIQSLKVGSDYIKKNKRELYFAIASHITLQRAKIFLLQKMNEIQSVGSFIRTPNGFRVTAPEGFVAISSGGAVKLVDRLEFSKQNFQLAKDWVKG